MNNITLKTYENSIDDYILGTPDKVSGAFKIWIDHTLKYLDKSKKILELGTGTGRDADYIESLGYKIQRSDAVHAFVEYQKKKGKSCILIDARTLSLKEKYDLLFANAVMLHFTKQEFSQVLKNIKKILNKKGLFSFNIKQGIGEEFSNQKVKGPRFFKYWEKEELENTLKQEGFTILYLTIVDDNKRIHCICQK